MFKKAENSLLQQGYEVLNPMELPHEHDKSWESYMRECIKALCDCDGILMLYNFQDSKGSLEELRIAKLLNLFIQYQMKF